MANRPHVPKFGDWSNQEQPFTVVFDNARTNKRQDLYENLEKPETKPQPIAPPPTQPKAPSTQPKAPQPAPRNQRPEQPKPVRDDTPRAPPPTGKPNRVKAPPADQLYGGGLYGGYGAGSGSGNQRPPPAPRPVQPKYNPRAGNNGRGGTTIPPFPGSLGAGENMSYTHIFDKVKEERNNGAYGGTANNTPSRPINGHSSTPPTSSWIRRCFPCLGNSSKY